MKEDATMKKRIIAMALVIMLMFALCACGKKQEAAPAATQAPEAQTEAPAPEAAPAESEAPAQTEAPAETEAPKESPKGIEPDSGVYPITSVGKGFTIDYDSKYVANELMSGVVIINAGTVGTGEGIPYCTVNVMSKEDAGDAVTLLNNLAASAQEELDKDLETLPGEPVKVLESRDIYYIYYTYKDKDAGGTVCCAFYAENLDNGDVAVFNSLALEKDADTVNAILKLAIESFKRVG